MASPALSSVSFSLIEHLSYQNWTRRTTWSSSASGVLLSRRDIVSFSSYFLIALASLKAFMNLCNAPALHHAGRATNLFGRYRLIRRLHFLIRREPFRRFVRP